MATSLLFYRHSPVVGPRQYFRHSRRRRSPCIDRALSIIRMILGQAVSLFLPSQVDGFRTHACCPTPTRAVRPGELSTALLEVAAATLQTVDGRGHAPDSARPPPPCLLLLLSLFPFPLSSLCGFLGLPAGAPACLPSCLLPLLLSFLLPSPPLPLSALPTSSSCGGSRPQDGHSTFFVQLRLGTQFSVIPTPRGLVPMACRGLTFSKRA